MRVARLTPFGHYQRVGCHEGVYTRPIWKHQQYQETIAEGPVVS